MPSLRGIEMLQFFLQPYRRSWGAFGWGQCPTLWGCAVTPKCGAAWGACWQVLGVVAQADLLLSHSACWPHVCSLTSGHLWCCLHPCSLALRWRAAVSGWDG